MQIRVGNQSEGSMMTKHMNSMSGSVSPGEASPPRYVTLAWRARATGQRQVTIFVNFGDYYISSRIIKSTKLTNPFMLTTIRLLKCNTNNMTISKIVSIRANKMEVEIFNNSYD